ncbi:MAG: hypothetical protein FWF06_08505 [Symbiobacteriaceae bacterium]|nr:hypothetical protein [Symbiobacteriaceae bacterium]
MFVCRLGLGVSFVKAIDRIEGVTMKILDVRRVGYSNALQGDLRSPESFAFPACLTSLLEAKGEDINQITIHAHGREYLKRTIYDGILAATGMSFGLLWNKDT